MSRGSPCPSLVHDVRDVLIAIGLAGCCLAGSMVVASRENTPAEQHPTASSFQSERPHAAGAPRPRQTAAEERLSPVPRHAAPPLGGRPLDTREWLFTAAMSARGHPAQAAGPSARRLGTAIRMPHATPRATPSPERHGSPAIRIHPKSVEVTLPVD